ncbi:hypothetical protein OROGR_012073 [Orobanche gracilis]
MLNHPTLVARPNDMKTKTSQYLFSSALLVSDWPTLYFVTILDLLSTEDIAYDVKYRIVAVPKPMKHRHSPGGTYPVRHESDTPDTSRTRSTRADT